MQEYQHIDHGFGPVFDSRSHVLILGSFPSVLSRQNSFYYGNPQNRFWHVIAACVGAPTPPNTPLNTSIQAKRQLLKDAGIALWDVIESCDIKGSADSTIRHAVPANLNIIFDAASIEAVYANGRTAEALYHRLAEAHTKRPIIGLPSTSPANAAWSKERLIDSWKKALDPYL